MTRLKFRRLKTRVDKLEQKIEKAEWMNKCAVLYSDLKLSGKQCQVLFGHVVDERPGKIQAFNEDYIICKVDGWLPNDKKFGSLMYMTRCRICGTKFVANQICTTIDSLIPTYNWKEYEPVEEAKK